MSCLKLGIRERERLGGAKREKGREREAEKVREVGRDEGPREKEVESGRQRQR